MSKIRLHGSSSGYTEIAPVAASGNNTLTLPNDGTIISQDSNGAVGVTSIPVGTGVTIGDGRVTCSTLHGSAANCTQIPAANIVGVCTSGFSRTGGFGGITMSDNWRITASYSANLNSDFSSNWERVDTNIPGFIGEGMSQSSGVFTFPSTGIYLVRFVSRGNSNDQQYVGSSIYVTSDNGSSYGTAADSYDSSSGSSYYFTNFCEVVLDITDTSNQKVKFTANSGGTTATWNGSSSSTETGATFIRLGDT